MKPNQLAFTFFLAFALPNCCYLSHAQENYVPGVRGARVTSNNQTEAIQQHGDAERETQNVSPDNENRYIVKFVDQAQFEAEDNRLLRTGGHQKKIMSLPEDLVQVMELDTDDEVRYWADRDDVEYIERDQKVYLLEPQLVDGDRNLQLEPEVESVPWGINAVKAFSISDGLVSNRKICIIDSGYDIEHPDLQNSTDIVTGSSHNDDADLKWSTDRFGHGTHVAGTIAALGGNNRGVAGVIRNGQVNLHIVKVLDTHATDWIWASGFIDAAEKCVHAGANIINMSLAGENDVRLWKDSFKRIYEQNNVLLVAASGNLGTAAYSYPASYPSVISVGSIAIDNTKSPFSQHNDQVDLVAPGSNIKSTLPGGGYGYDSGTSMATPHVSGVAALVWSQFPGYSAKEIRKALEAKAEDLGEQKGRDNMYGHGLVRADLAHAFLDSLATFLQETDDNWDFILEPKSYDLYGIKKRGTQSRKTEVYVLSRACNYKNPSIRRITGLHETNNDWKFALNDDLDSYAIKKRGKSRRTEVHILSKASNYESFSDNKVTGLHRTNDDWEFLLSPNRDLFGIKKRGTGSGRTEVHVLSAGSKYKKFSLQIATPLPEIRKDTEDWEFALDAHSNLCVIKKCGNRSGKTELHVLSRRSNYQSYSDDFVTGLDETNDDWEFALAPNSNLYGIKKRGTGSARTEVHRLSFERNYNY